MIAETIFTLGAVILSLALLPTVLNKDAYVPQSSSLITAIILTWYTYAFLLLGQSYSAATTAITAAMWWYILGFRGEMKTSAPMLGGN